MLPDLEFDNHMTDIMKPSTEAAQRLVPGSTASACSPYSSANSSDTEDWPLPPRGMGIFNKAVEGLSINECGEQSSLEPASLDEVQTVETSSRASIEEGQALSSPAESLSPCASMFSLNALGKFSQEAEKVEQRLKLARLMLNRSKVVTHPTSYSRLIALRSACPITLSTYFEGCALQTAMPDAVGDAPLPSSCRMPVWCRQGTRLVLSIS